MDHDSSIHIYTLWFLSIDKPARNQPTTGILRSIQFQYHGWCQRWRQTEPKFATQTTTTPCWKNHPQHNSTIRWLTQQGHLQIRAPHLQTLRQSHSQGILLRRALAKAITTGQGWMMVDDGHWWLAMVVPNRVIEEDRGYKMASDLKQWITTYHNVQLSSWCYSNMIVCLSILPVVETPKITGTLSQQTAEQSFRLDVHIPLFWVLSIDQHLYRLHAAWVDFSCTYTSDHISVFLKS